MGIINVLVAGVVLLLPGTQLNLGRGKLKTRRRPQRPSPVTGGHCCAGDTARRGAAALGSREARSAGAPGATYGSGGAIPASARTRGNQIRVHR